MARLFFLLVALSLAAFALAREERLNEVNRHLLELLKRLEGRQIEKPVEKISASNGEKEVNLTGSRDIFVRQSSALPGWRLWLVADKAVDGRYSDSNFLGEDGKEYGGSCTITNSQENPHWQAHFREEICISKVSILNRGDGFSERMTDAVVQFGYSPYRKLNANPTCGSPVTAEQAAVPGGTIEVECSEPMGGRFLTIGIPADNATLQLCEIRVWAIPMDQCPDASNGEREVNLTGSRDVIVKQSSALPGWRLWLVADKAVDGRYSDSNFLGEDGKEYGGSCTITNSQKNPYWRAHFREEICISKVSILNRGDGFSERMTDAVVQFGYSPYRKLNANPTCGSPVTAEQAAVPGGTIEVECSEPMGGRFLTIGIPADNATLQLCEIRVWAIPMDQCPDASNGEREVNLTGSRDVIVKQSSALPGWRLWLVADKAVDGRYSDSNFLGEDGKEYGGSCTITNSQKNPYWRAHFREEICISKVSILNRGDGFSERMTDAVVQFGYSPYRKLNANPTCGSPVTAEQAAVPGGTIEVECSEPMGGRFLTIGIPSDNATLQLCEIRVWAIPMDQCPDEIKAETELDVERTSVGQSSIVGNEYSSRAALKVRDGQYNNSNLLGEGGEMYGGSCTITKAQKDPSWGMMSFKEYCFSKVWILNRGDGFSERLTGAVVRIGSEKSTDLNNNTACGSPVTAEQAAVPGGTIEVECSHPIKGFLTIIGIPADNATLQLCEVRAWVVPMAQCSPDFEECSSDPCQNGATCVDGINKFSCTCAAGFTGPLCESNIDECSSDPCQNGATCVDGINEFSCSCAAGFLGTLCADDVDECGSDPCLNGATCVDGVNEVSCTCASGYSGVVCEIDINECDSSPCQNGVCIEGVDSFSCECSPGYEGVICETNTNECVSNPCQNGATCVDGINKVSCKCVEGFTGSVCETAVRKMDGCTTNPCKNGICITYGVDGVKCACAPGYQGTVCEINIDECSSNPCQNDAKCVDGINKVSCICAPGFSGELCQIEQTDGLPDNLPQLPQGFSLAGTKVETQTSYMQVNLITEYCIKKVIVHKSGDCTSNRLTGAVVRGGTSSTSLNNSVCGTPLTAQQVEIRRSTVDFVCDPPMTAKFVTVDIPMLRVSQKPLCEVTIEQATPGPC